MTETNTYTNDRHPFLSRVGLHESHAARLQRYNELIASRPVPEVSRFDLIREYLQGLPTKVKVAAGVTAVAVLGVAFEGTAVANVVNGGVGAVGEQMNGLAVPGASDAETITIGDTIAYTDKDGKRHTQKVTMLSDIAVAAATTRGLDSSDVDIMLEKEVGNTDQVGFGDKVQVPKTWGIEDIGDSAG